MRSAIAPEISAGVMTANMSWNIANDEHRDGVSRPRPACVPVARLAATAKPEMPRC